MLGERVADPHGIEAGGECPGLQLLPVHTSLELHKETRQLSLLPATLPFAPYTPVTIGGYAIHHGQTQVGAGANVWLSTGNTPAGVQEGNVWGTYVHGLFDNDDFRDAWLATLRVQPTHSSWSERIEGELDRLADVVASSIDLPAIQRWLAL
jgi:adenosylcobyric acid synthase